jgi:hypothetical protein
MEEKNSHKHPDWKWFIFWSSIAIYAFFSKAIEGIGFIVPSLVALLGLQHTEIMESAKTLVTDLWQPINRLVSSIFNVVFALIFFILIVLFVSKAMGGLLSFGKYEGQTAKEWFYEYDAIEERYQQFRECVEEYDNLDIEDQIQYGGVFYYCE